MMKVCIYVYTNHVPIYIGDVYIALFSSSDACAITDGQYA